MNIPISAEQRIAIIDRQIAEWKEVGFNAETAALVHARIGSDPASIKSYADRAVQAEKAIHVLNDLRANIVKEGERA